jgi:hypothetical protein
MLCYAMLCYAMLCYAMLCYAILFFSMLCCAVLCYAMLCYAMLCCAMLCYAVLDAPRDAMITGALSPTLEPPAHDAPAAPPREPREGGTHALEPPAHGAPAAPPGGTRRSSPYLSQAARDAPNPAAISRTLQNVWKLRVIRIIKK